MTIYDILVLVFWFCMQVAGYWWMRIGSPPAHIEKKYNKDVILSYKMLNMFSIGWKNRIDPEDVGHYEKYRKRFVIYYYFILVIPFFGILGFYMSKYLVIFR